MVVVSLLICIKKKEDQHLKKSNLVLVSSQFLQKSCGSHRTDFFHQRRDLVLCDRLLIDLDALLYRDQVRRREEPDAIAGVLEDGAEHRRS